MSETGNLDKDEMKKILKGTAIAFSGAFLLVIADWLIQGDISWVLFRTACLTAAFGAGVNAVRKYLTTNYV